MTREQIEKVALLFAGAGEFGECPYNPDAKNGFIVGAQWRINSVWHDAHEEPQRSGMLIASNEDGNYILCGPNNSNWKQTVKLFRIMNWAYIIDLLPERKEETK